MPGRHRLKICAGEHDEYMIRELLFEGSSRRFDQDLCTGLTVTDEEIDDLCKAMKAQAIQNAHREEQKASVRDVGRQQLRAWGHSDRTGRG